MNSTAALKRIQQLAPECAALDEKLIAAAQQLAPLYGCQVPTDRADALAFAHWLEAMLTPPR